MALVLPADAVLQHPRVDGTAVVDGGRGDGLRCRYGQQGIDGRRPAGRRDVGLRLFGYGVGSWPSLLAAPLAAVPGARSDVGPAGRACLPAGTGPMPPVSDFPSGRGGATWRRRPRSLLTTCGSASFRHRCARLRLAAGRDLPRPQSRHCSLAVCCSPAWWRSSCAGPLGFAGAAFFLALAPTSSVCRSSPKSPPNIGCICRWRR